MAAATAKGLLAFESVLESISSEQPLAVTMNLIAQTVAEVGRFDFCAVLLRDPSGEHIRVTGAHRLPPRYEHRLEQIFVAPVADESLTMSPTVRAIRLGRAVVVADALQDNSYAPWKHLAIEYGWRSLVSAPLKARGQSVGVINGYSNRARRYTTAEVAAVEMLAKQAALALRLTVLVERQHETIEALSRVNNQLDEHRRVLERAHEIHLRLTDAVMSGAGFEEVAGTLAELIGRRVEVTTAGHKLICAAEPTTVGGARATHRGVQGIQAPIHIGSELLGHVETGPGEASSRELDLRAVEHAATVLAFHVAKERATRATEERLAADFVFDLLNGRDTEERLRRRGRHHGLDLDRSHRVMRIALDNWSTYQSGDAQRTRILGVAATALTERLAGVVSSQVGDAVTAIVPVDPNGSDPIAALRHAASHAGKRVAAIAPGLTISVGIGGVARQPDALAGSLRDARRCVDVLQRLNRIGQVMVVDELGVLGLFLDTERVEEIAELGRRVLGPAVRSDAANQGALLETLDAYLDLDCSVAAAARRLFVHVNTVKYRLRRIEQLCNLDLRRAEDLMTASIARLSLRLTGP